MLGRGGGASFRATHSSLPPMRPITDHAEVSIDFPEKAYIGTFGHTASFGAAAAPGGVDLKFAHGAGAKRGVDMHLHWYLFADIIDEIAASLEGRTGLVDEAHRAALGQSVQRLAGALAAPVPTPQPGR